MWAFENSDNGNLIVTDADVGLATTPNTRLYKCDDPGATTFLLVFIYIFMSRLFFQTQAKRRVANLRRWRWQAFTGRTSKGLVTSSIMFCWLFKITDQ